MASIILGVSPDSNTVSFNIFGLYRDELKSIIIDCSFIGDLSVLHTVLSSFPNDNKLTKLYPKFLFLPFSHSYIVRAESKIVFRAD